MEKCFVCGKEAETKLTVEPTGGNLYVCDNLDCKEDALMQLEEFKFDHQGKKLYQVEFSEMVGGIAMIIMISTVVGMILFNLLNAIS